MGALLAVLELALAVAGLALAMTALAQARRALRRPPGSPRDISWLAGFRRFVLGAALVGVAASLVLDVTWLLLLSLAIGGEEVLETTLLLDGLRRGPSIRLHP